MSAYQIIAAALLAAAVAAGGYRYGHHVGTVEQQAEYERQLGDRDRAASKALADALARQKANIEAAEAAEREALAQQQQHAARVEVITHEVVRWRTRQAQTGHVVCGIDNAGLDLWNAANKGE